MRRNKSSRALFHRLALVNPASALFIAAALTPVFGRAMEIQWTRMAGQWPVEASALVADFSHSGKAEILVLNRGGQVLLWATDSTAIGPGQDGLVAQLPAGRWTTAPTLVEAPEGARLLAASVAGLVVGLDQKFQVLWQYKLPGETGWGRAIPAPLTTSAGAAFPLGAGAGVVH